MKRFILFTIINILICLSIAGAADDNSSPVAKLIQIKGKVYLQKFNEEKRSTAPENTKIYGEDTVITEIDSECVILYNNGNSIKVSPESEVKVNDRIDKEEDSNSITCFIGSIFAKIKKLGKKETFNITTPTAVVGVRGTKFMVASGEDGVSLIGVTDGTVEVENAYNKKLTIKENEQTEISYDSETGKKSGFQHNKFNRQQWMKKRKESFQKNKDKILNDLEKRFDNFENKFKMTQKKIKGLQIKRRIWIKSIQKAKKSNQPDRVALLRKRLIRNFKEFARVIKTARRMNNRFMCHGKTFNRFKKIKGFKDFEKKYAEKFKKMHANRTKFRKNIINHHKDKRNQMREFRQNMKDDKPRGKSRGSKRDQRNRSGGRRGRNR